MDIVWMQFTVKPLTSKQDGNVKSGNVLSPPSPTFNNMMDSTVAH